MSLVAEGPPETTDSTSAPVSEGAGSASTRAVGPVSAVRLASKSAIAARFAVAGSVASEASEALGSARAAGAVFGKQTANNHGEFRLFLVQRGVELLKSILRSG